MTAADIIEDALKAKGWSQKQLAKEMGQSPQNLSKKLSNNTITAQEFLDAIGHLGYEVKFLADSGREELKTRKRGVGDRIRKMVNGVIYDTARSDALCRTLWTDGWMMELYRDEEGRFFVAHYTTWEGGVNHITPCTPENARRLYEEYGEGEPSDVIFGVA